MISSIYTSFVSETQKVKGTFTFWFTIMGSLLIPFIYFLIYFFRFENFVPPKDINPWDIFIQGNLKSIAFILFPLHVILTIAINLNIEHRANSWKKLFVLPVKRESIYIGKLLFLLFQVGVSLIIFTLSILIFGYLLGFIHSELNFSEYPPKLLQFLKSIIRLFIAVLGIFSIQYVLGLFVKNIIIPISLGVFLTIVATIIVQGWEHSIYFPYAFPMYFFLNSNQLAVIDTHYGLTISEITSFTTFIIVNILGLIMFKLKRIS
tara:strand:- start:756 stop:1544 length:789 start_codon:yes stop_codon:yes gene_type:complete